MLSLTRLKQFLADAKSNISTIHYTDIVVDDSQLVKVLKERIDTDNDFLIAIVPQYNIEGTENSIQWNNQLMFFVLAKNNDKEFETNDQFIDVFDQTRATTQSLVNYLVGEKSGDNGDMCGLANQLKENSIQVSPVWEKAQCNGWMIQIDLLSRP